MARGIMADNTEKVASPTSELSESKSRDAINPLNHTSGSAAPCSCTKISTMQLFYEMKQKFPTVPDNVVCEFVGQNCHNRSACIDSLEDYPNSANVYPQALRNQPSKKKSNRSQLDAASDKQTDAKLSESSKENVNLNVASNEMGNQLKPPNTLNLRNLNCCTRPTKQPCRPTRQAPPPPTAISLHQQKSLPNQPLNLSVNVIVSPVSRQPNQPNQQPLSHYSFTLHQPNSNKSVSAHPTNSTHPECMPTNADATDNATLNVPSLRYTSSAYDGEIGYQSRLEITVAANEFSDPIAENVNSGSNISLKRSCEITTDNNLPSVVASSEFLEETETVHHQILCKQKLVLELEKDRKRLERMQRELQAMQAPLPDGGLEALTIEIEKLRNDCKLMAQHVEEAGPSYALGETNEAFYRNIYTGQQLPMQQRQPLRPHRPAPSPDFRHQQNRPKHQANIVGADSRFISSAPIAQSPLSPHFNESNADAGWICDLCTFQNKYTQQTCEACTKPFLSAGNQMGYNNNGTFVQPTPPYPLTHYMPMPMHTMPLNNNNNNNNNNNMPYVYYQPTSMPAYPPLQFYSAPSLTDPHPRF